MKPREKRPYPSLKPVASPIHLPVQQSAVYLACSATRKFREVAEVGWNHVLGQHLSDGLAELGRRQLAFAFIEEHNHLLCPVVYDASVRDELQRVDYDMLDFAKLDAVAGVLYERVLAPLEHYLAALVARDDVAGSIDDFGIGLIQWVLSERRRSLFGIVVIPHGERCAANAQLALLIALDKLVLGVENQDVGIPAWEADWQWLVVAELARDLEPGAIERDFDWAIEVYETRPRQVPLPDVELLCREHLAGEPHRLQVWKRHLLQKAHIRHIHHDSRHPEYPRHLFFLQKLEYLDGEHRPAVGYQDERCTFGGKEAKLKAVYVEDDGGEGADNHSVFHGPSLERALHEVEEAAVVEDNALRRSRRA